MQDILIIKFIFYHLPSFGTNIITDAMSAQALLKAEHSCKITRVIRRAHTSGMLHQTILITGSFYMSTMYLQNCTQGRYFGSGHRVKKQVYSIDILVGSADCTICTPSTHTFTFSSPLDGVQHLLTLLHQKRIVTV